MLEGFLNGHFLYVEGKGLSSQDICMDILQVLSAIWLVHSIKQNRNLKSGLGALSRIGLDTFVTNSSIPGQIDEELYIWSANIHKLLTLLCMLHFWGVGEELFI